jgi:hypothetical protein
MAEEYKVRLGDGSEIGPMSLQAVRDWHRQGLIGPTSRVLRPGFKRWTTLDQVLEPQAFGKGSATKAMPRQAPAPAARRGAADRSGASLRLPPRALLGALGALLVATAGGAAYWLFAHSATAPPQAHEPSAAGTPSALDALVSRAVESATSEVPILTPEAARILMSRSQAQVLVPELLFRRSLDALTRALATMSPAEVKDVGQIMTALYGTLSGRDRARLADYIDRVRGRRQTTAQEDREMCAVMKAAVLHVPVPTRRRLQALCEKAVRAAP